MSNTKVFDVVWGVISLWLLVYILFHLSEVTSFLDALLRWRPPE